MQKYNSKMHGAADYNKYVMIPSDTWDSISQETDDNIDPYREGKFAQMVYVANGIQIGDGSGNTLNHISTYGRYITEDFQNIDGSSASASTTSFIEDTVVRVKSYDGDNWVKRTDSATTAVEGEGMLMLEGEENTMFVKTGDIISCIGGKLNIVPVEV
jgi:hypothetical protein